jgi:hypothetical protein
MDLQLILWFMAVVLLPEFVEGEFTGPSNSIYILLYIAYWLVKPYAFQCIFHMFYQIGIIPY